VVPLRGAVVLPMTVAPLGVSRTLSVEAVNRALAGDRLVLLLMQKTDADEPTMEDLHRVGTVAAIRQMAKAQTGMRVLVEGIVRARAEFLQSDKGVLTALLKPMPEASDRTIEIEAHVRRLQELVDRALSLATGLSPDLKTLVSTLDDPLHRLPAREPARHEAGRQAAPARGKQPGRQAGRRGDGAGARD
jgi:ATP-dependent Lon protease